MGHNIVIIWAILYGPLLFGLYYMANFQVNLGTMENESYIPSFGENEELEFDVHEHDGKRRAINVTGPGGAPLKGFIFKPRDAETAKN